MFYSEIWLLIYYNTVVIESLDWNTIVSVENILGFDLYGFNI